MLWVNFDPILAEYPSAPSLDPLFHPRRAFCYSLEHSSASLWRCAAASSINCGASILKWDLVTSTGHPPAVLAGHGDGTIRER